METIKVNMNPNPLDVQTIHASQNDGEARQWGFELHNNGDVIDASEITEQIVFKAYKGGTEQILPENTSTPTTSPFLGDIRYPQGLLTDQEFTYRQSPTESDGLAKITDIKGNTIVWNQLIQNGNFESTSGWSSGGNRGTLSANNNELSYTITEIGTSTELNRIQRSASFIQDHIYLLMFDFYALRNGTMRGILGGSQNVRGRQIPCVSGWNKYADILTANSTNTTVQGCFSAQTDYSVGEVVKWRNFMLIDLTMLNDSHITDYDSFRTYYPLDYYDYNQGSLLSFNGNGIKTVGFNQWDEEWEAGSYSSVGEKVPTSGGRIRSVNKIPVLPNTTYYMSKGVNILCQYDANKSFISFMQLGVDSPSNVPHTVSLGANTHYIAFATYAQYGTTYKNDICINMSDAERNGTYEPYTSSTLSLPISTYFPTGMKSAGNVYDELTPRKAISRIGAIDLGSLNWVVNPNVNGGFNCRIDDMKLGVRGQMSSVICPLYETINTKYYGAMNTMQNMQIAQSNATQGELYLINTSYSDADTFKQAMSGIPLYFELTTPTETEFTTASLVTENAEIPLSNEDGVLIGKCTEQLSENPGFIDAKIKLADSDGECYSNKIQLHVERKPS